MTEFEKKLISELKGIRKELEKSNKKPSQETMKQIGKLMQANQIEIQIDGEEIARNIIYDPLGSR